MAYCTVDDVQKLIPTSLWNSATATQPSAATVTEDFIPDIDSEIDGALAGRYEVPITGTEALRLVNAIATRMVAIKIWGLVFTGQTGVTDHPKDWDEGGRKLLLRIAAGDMDLIDATETGDPTAAHPGPPVGTYPPLKRAAGELDADYPIFHMDDQF